MRSEDRAALADGLNDPDAAGTFGFVLVGVGIPHQHHRHGHKHRHDEEAADIPGGGPGRDSQDQVPDRGDGGEEGGEWAADPPTVGEEGDSDDQEEAEKVWWCGEAVRGQGGEITKIRDNRGEKER